MSLPGYTYECAIKYTGIELQTLQNKELILFLEFIVRGCNSLWWLINMFLQMERKSFLYIDAKNLCGCVMSESLPYDEIRFDWNVILENILNTSDESVTG